MKPLLVIGLGNPLMGDDGVGWTVAERLASDPRFPETAEAICGGTDLLRYAARMEGRRRVVLLDAVDDGAPLGTVAPVDCGLGAGDRQEHAHHLSEIQSVALLRLTMNLPVTLLGISISGASLNPGLSTAMEERMPRILSRVLEELQWNSSM